MTKRVIALLGRKDEPTDAVEEYCHYLGGALQAHEIQLEIRRVPWEIHGWSAALGALALQARTWRDTWVLVQYTALAWSQRGFPQKFLRALEILKSAGARVAIVFHDVEPYAGTRLVDSFRRAIQVRVMRRALVIADLAIFTVQLYRISWLPFRPRPVVYTDRSATPPTNMSPRALELAKEKLSPQVFGLISERQQELSGPRDPSPLLAKCHFIPVGPNLPIPPDLPSRPAKVEVPTIGIFSITGGPAGAHETEAILTAVRQATRRFGRLRLSVFGRHAELREQDLRNDLSDLPVELSVEGVVTAAQVVERLCACDVLLFVRGGISTRRSSAIAAIACGVPTVAYVGGETAYPITEAGVIVVSPSDPKELLEALVLLLSDVEFRAGMRLRNALAYAEHFAWPAIATRFAALLQPPSPSSSS